MGTAGEGSLRTLLILSAIDLLSSAVTAGLVLFVVLVGADAGASKGDASAATGTGLYQVEVISLDRDVGLSKLDKPSQSSVVADKVEADFFGSGAKLPHKFYLVPTSLKRLMVESAKVPFELAVQPISGDPIRLFVRCVTGQDRFEISIEPLTLPECVAMTGDQKVLTLGGGQTLILSPNQAIPSLPQESRRTSGFAKFKLTNALALPTGVSVWGLSP